MRIAGDELEPVTRALRERLADRCDPDADRRALTAFAQRLAGGAPPTPGQASMLLVLSEQPATLVELAERAGTTVENARRLLAVLHARGWTHRGGRQVPLLSEPGRLALDLSVSTRRRGSRPKLSR